MRVSKYKLTTVFSVFLAATVLVSPAVAEPLFFDDFEDRVRDQPLIGNDWTWYNQTYSDDLCTVYQSGYGPYDENQSGATYEQQNRNYWTASPEEGDGGDYYRAGLEVPAWATDEGEKVVLSNMLRVYGDPNYNPGVTSCKRTLIFQEMPVVDTGGFTFSFDVAMDRVGAPAFGEVTAAFVKVIKTSDSSYNELLFEKVETNPPLSTTPENASMASQSVSFTITDAMVGELLQFGFYTDIVEDLGQGVGTSAALYDNVKLDTTDIGPAHSGSWFNLEQSGHGFSIEFGLLNGSRFAIAYWYTYDDAGNPIFMVGSGVPDGQEVVITFDSPVGMKYGEFVPVEPPNPVGGVAVFNFTDRTHATFSYTPSNFSETEWGHTTPIENLPITRLFGIPADKNFPDTE